MSMILIYVLAGVFGLVWLFYSCLFLALMVKEEQPTNITETAEISFHHFGISFIFGFVVLMSDIGKFIRR